MNREKPATAFTRDQLGLILIGMRERGVRSEADLARALDLEPQSVYKWFDGQRGASKEVRRRLAELLGIPPERLEVGATDELEPATSNPLESPTFRGDHVEVAEYLMGLAQQLLRNKESGSTNLIVTQKVRPQQAVPATVPRALVTV